jgi:hypothetical protein
MVPLSGRIASVDRMSEVFVANADAIEAPTERPGDRVGRVEETGASVSVCI